MEHFASDYDVEKAIAEYEGLPYLAKKDCNCWDGYERVPGTKPCAPGSCRKCDENSKKESKLASQGDKPSPKAAQAVFNALAEGNEDAAIELLGHTDCPEGCETHPEGKCNHQYMSAGRTRVRYLVNTQAFKEADDNPRGTGTTDHESPVKESSNDNAETFGTGICPTERCGTESEIFYDGGYKFDCPKCNFDMISTNLEILQEMLSSPEKFHSMTGDKPPVLVMPQYRESPVKEAGILQDVVQMGPDIWHSIPHVWNEINPAGSGAVGTFLNQLNPAGDGLAGDAVGAAGDFVKERLDPKNDPNWTPDVAHLRQWRLDHPGPEYADQWERMRDGFISWWESRGVDNPGQYIGQ